MNKVSKKLIFIQLNEINFDLIKKFYNTNNLKIIKNIIKDIKYTTSEKKYELLEPWIQWFSIFSGLKAKNHKIFRLGDGVNYKKKLLYNKIENKGYSVGAISPMNLKNTLINPSYFIPDPWTKTDSDKSFLSRQLTKILRKTVNENANNKIEIKDYFKLFGIVILAVRLKDYFYFFKLVLSSFKYKWRKALILDYIVHSIHLKLLKKKNPNFSSVFFNAGAHIQHHYLLNSKVNISKLKNPSFKVPKKKDPFIESIEFYNKILSDYFLIEDTELIIATGLTQKIVKKIDFYYRLKNHKNFLTEINIKFKDVNPLMSRDFVIEFANNTYRDIAASKLSSITLNKKKIFGLIKKRKKSLFVTLTYNKEIKENDYIYCKKNKLFNFYNKISFVALKNAVHDQKGFLFNKSSINFKKKINVAEINEKIVNYF